MPPSSYDFWQKIEGVDTSSFVETRNQFHQAVQNVAAVGRIFLPPSTTDEHAVLEWSTGLQRLVGQWIQGEIKFRSSFDLEKFSVYLVDGSYTMLSSLALGGKKQGAVMVWLEEQLALLGVDSSQISLNLPYDLPEYPQAKGKVFDPDQQQALHLSRLFHNAWLVISQFTSLVEGFGLTKVLPESLEMTAKQIVKDTGEPDTSASVSVGMSPGDESIREPYFYVRSWPFADTLDFPILERGEWCEEDWVGAALRLSQLTHETNATLQQRNVLDFFRQAYPPLRASIK